ncbi:MAG TPA: hypothetical protein VEI46_00720 [Thermodesulfovibrionales bacterium]|nr:hypothetical protein [Thermodesulfovibrionales bacterium]
MKRFIYIVLFLDLCFVPSAWAGLNADTNVGAPALTLPGVATPVVQPQVVQYNDQPDLIVVPSGGQYVYMMPGTEGMYFYQGIWYRYYQGFWYRAPLYSRTWATIQLAAVPPVIIAVPPTYPLYVPAGYYRIHFVDLATHWREWERSRYWDRQPWYRAEVRARQARITNIERDRAMRANEKGGAIHETERHEAKKPYEGQYRHEERQ